MSRLLHESLGSGRMVFVGGEAGIGKTVLIRRLRQMVSQSARVLVGACDPLSTPRPLAPLDDVVADMESGARLREMMGSGQRREALYRAVLDALSGKGKPTLLVFEDLHWADEATLDLVRYLGRRIEATNCLLISTYRDDEVGEVHPLRVVLGDLATASSVSRVKLQPLTLEAVRTLTRTSGAINATDLHQQTGGNPFFVTEVLAAGTQGIPPTVRDAVLARAARLPAGARAALDNAAVIGYRIEPSLLDAVAGCGGEAIDTCVQSGMLQTQGQLYVFRHELARDAILDAVPPARRREAHRRVLEELGRNGAIEPARLAHHAEGAGDTAAVLRFAPEAARRAEAASSFREAAAQYSRALRFAATVEPATRLELLERYSNACATIDNYDEAIRVDRQIIEICEQIGDRRKLGWAYTYLGGCLIQNGQSAQAEAESLRSIEILESLPESKELAEAYSLQTTIRMLNRDYQESIAWARRTMEVAERQDALDPKICALSRMGTSLLLLGDESGRGLLEESSRLAAEAGRHSYVSLAFGNLGSVAGELYQFPRALGYLTQGVEYASAHELEASHGYMTAWLASTYLHLGRWEEAEENARAALSRPNTAGLIRVMAMLARAKLATRRGSPDAETVLRTTIELSEQIGMLQRRAPARAAFAEWAWLNGQCELIGPEVAEVCETAVANRHPWFAGELLFWLHSAGGRPTVPEWIASPFARQIAGDWKGAAEEWRQLECPYEMAQALAMTGEVEALQEARSVFERLGAEPWLRRVNRELRDHGVRGTPRGPRPETRKNPAGLTGRQLQITRLLAEGLQNSEIADRLFLSPKTVDHHVSTILTKLHVRSRTEAAQAAARLGIVSAQDRDPSFPN